MQSRSTPPAQRRYCASLFRKMPTRERQGDPIMTTHHAVIPASSERGRDEQRREDYDRVDEAGAESVARDSKPMVAAATQAPGWPGIPGRWTSSAKVGVGTALNRVSRVWFTISHGILNEVYYP